MPKEITLNKGGTKEKVVPVNHIEIPDLWHLAMDLEADPRYTPRASEAVLELWHLAHDMKRELLEETTS